MKLGIDIGGTKCAVVLGDEASVHEKIRFETTDCPGTLKSILAAAHRFSGFDAIGVSCGGPLDRKRGLILSPPNLPGWDEVPITDLLQKEFGVPAYLCNDANACALAEWKYGAGKGVDNMVFLTFGTGMGAGLILGGRLYEGTSDNAGEIGHIRMEKEGPIGYRKIGSFEGFCSGGGLAQLGKAQAGKALREGKRPLYCQTAADLAFVTAKTIAEAALAGDETALAVYCLCGEKLGQGIALLMDILNPERIVIGSIFERAEALLRPAMEDAIRREALPGCVRCCDVVPAALGDRIGDFAALAVAYEGDRL